MKQNKKTSFIEQTNDKIIESLKNGTAPWIKPWSANELNIAAPYNGASSTKYRGVNTINLFLTAQNNGYNDPRWFTYNQAKKLNAFVKKGEKSTIVQHWIFNETRDKLDENGNLVYNQKGEVEKETVKLDKPKVVYHNVFNAEQIENIPKLTPKKQLEDFQINQRAENILKNSGADITHSNENRAYYNSHSDYIVLPQKSQFKSEGAYYATALHELGHWTGHEDRLNRDLANPFGSKGYAKEELRAEIGSFLLSAEIGLDYDPGQHMSYIDSWVEILEDKPTEIFKACADSTKIFSYVTNLEISQEQKQEISQEQKQEISQEQKQEEPTLKRENFNEFFSEVQDSDLARSLIGGQNWDNWVDEENGGHYKIEQILANKLSWALEDGNNIEEIENTMEDVQMYFSAIGKDFPLETPKEKILDYFDNIINSNLSQDLDQEKGQKMNISNEQTILYVPYEEKDEAKKLGAKWDVSKKTWYAPAGTDLNNFRKWEHEQVKVNKSNAIVLNSTDEITSLFAKYDINIEGTPEMDGKIHRVSSNLSKKNKKDAAYCIYSDTTTAGWVKDWKTNQRVNFIVNDGLNYSVQQLEKIHEQNKKIAEQRDLEREQLHLKTANKLEQEYIAAKWAYDQHPYLKKKGLTKNYYTKQDSKGNLLIPLRDVDGKLWTTQRIFRNGDKTNGVIRTPEEKAAGIEYSARKQGCFFTVGAKDIKNADRIIISEGFATAASVYEATKVPTVVAVDAGNIKHVVKAIKDKYPKKEIIIAGDNDIANELAGKVNVGKSKALETAKEYNIKTIFPNFTQNEAKNNLSDFNDLYMSRGINEVKKQFESLLKSKTQTVSIANNKNIKQVKSKTQGIAI